MPLSMVGVEDALERRDLQDAANYYLSKPEAAPDYCVLAY